MITLTFGQDVPNDRPAKKLLDNFLKRLRRYKDVLLYLWVAERQSRGAIHFHILTDYTDMKYINISWNEIVQRWQIANNFIIQEVYPNVIQVDNPAGYLAKYLTKGGQNIEGNFYNMSQSLSALTKPIYETCIDIPFQYLIPALEQALESFDHERYVLNRGGEPKCVLAREGILELAETFRTIANTIQNA